MTSRRLFIAGVGAQLLALLSGCASTIPTSVTRREGELTSAGLDWAHLEWRRGFEGQRRADLGDGRYLNPIFSGDRPDPSIIRDDGVYYMTFSSFDAYPGLLIWRSEDLVNWRPLRRAQYADRLGLGAGSVQARRSLFSLHPSAHAAAPLDLCDSRREHRRPMERANRSRSAAAHRSVPCRV